MSDTIQDDDEVIKMNENDFEEIIKKSESLKEDYYKRKSSSLSADKLPELKLGTWVTGLSKAEVIDIRVDKDSNIILTARIKDNGNIREIKVRDRSNIYSENNELVRLLEYKNIKEGNIPKLLGMEIPVYINRYALPSNELQKTQWKAYIPKSFDKLGILSYKINNFLRNIGYEGEFSSSILAISFLLLTLFWWSVAFILFNIGIGEIISILTSYNEILFISVVLSVIFTIYTPLILRLFNILKEKYIYYKNKDSLI